MSLPFDAPGMAFKETNLRKFSNYLKCNSTKLQNYLNWVKNSNIEVTIIADIIFTFLFL